MDTFEEVEYTRYIKLIRTDGSIAWVPRDESNSDYQRYLRWLENPDADETINVLTPTQEPGVVTNGDN